jgi:hypothetical protein
LSTNEEYRSLWNSEAGIANVTRVKSSIMIDSIPLLYSDVWTDIGTPGWVHTPYDNSTSTRAFDWVGVDRLQTHIQIVGLSVMHVLSAVTNPFLMEVYVGVAVVGAVAAALIYVERTWLYFSLKKLRREILITLDTQGIIAVIFLTCVFMILPLAFFVRIGRDEIAIYGFTRITNFRYYGKPFEMIAIMCRDPIVSDPGEHFEVTTDPGYPGNTYVLLPGLLLNLIVFGLLALLTVYAVLKLRYLWESHRSSARCSL